MVTSRIIKDIQEQIIDLYEAGIITEKQFDSIMFDIMNINEDDIYEDEPEGD